MKKMISVAVAVAFLASVSPSVMAAPSPGKEKKNPPLPKLVKHKGARPGKSTVKGN